MQFEQIKALNSMTLQVGLVGTDGLVIASDRRLQAWEIDPQNPISAGVSRSATTKFNIANGFVCCWSGDVVAQRAHVNVGRLEWKSIEGNVMEGLIAAGNEAWKQTFGNSQATAGPVRKVIVACPDRSLWVLDVYEFSAASRIYDKVVAGDYGNTARHFVQNYVPAKPVPMNQLILLAAHTILMGAKENPSGVGGLEVKLIPRDGPPFSLTPQAEDKLALLSESLDSSMRDRLLQTFDHGA